MLANDYQEQSTRTVNNDLEDKEKLKSFAMGIAGEAGEYVDIIKKWAYHGHFLDKDKAIEELGDLLFYIANSARLLGYPLGIVMANNVEKLLKRYPKGFSREASINRVV